MYLILREDKYNGEAWVLTAKSNPDLYKIWIPQQVFGKANIAYYKLFYLLQWKPFKNFEKWFLFPLKLVSFSRYLIFSLDILVMQKKKNN